MRFFSVVMVGALTACGPPVARMCPVPPSPVNAVQLAVEGLESTLSLPGPTVMCVGKGMTVALEVIDPEGTLVPTPVPPLSTKTVFDDMGRGTIERFSLSLPFTPDKPGRWTINASWSTGGTTVRTMVAAKSIAAPPSVLRRFIDRMDNCARGPFRTNAGLTACQRSDREIWIYSPDGQIQGHFPGVGLAVRGDEIWSWKDEGELEHRTAFGGSVRFDGAVPVGPGAEGVTLPNIAVRGENNRIQEISWNGTALSSRTIAEGYPFVDELVVTQGTQTWSGAGCLVERGCSQTQCEPVRTCTIPTGTLLAIDAQAIWSVASSTGELGFGVVPLLVNPLPLSIGRAARPTESILFVDVDLVFLPAPSAPMLEMPRLVRLKDSILIPRLSANEEVGFLAVPAPGTPLTMTADWIVSQGNDAFTLLATQTPPLQ